MLKMETTGTSWPPAGVNADKFSPSAGLLNYQWSDAVLQQELDDMNLLDPSSAAAQAVQQQQQSAQQHSSGIPRASTPTPFLNQGLSVEEEDRRKRSREAMENTSLESFLQDLGREEAGMGELPGGRTSPESDSRRVRSTSDSAARTKACRERARRERLNECFSDLAKVLEPGKAAKTDKTSIIADAVRVVTQLRAENGQLRQLNKFLEERVKTVEKEKSEQQLQLMLLQQNGPGPSLLAGAGGLSYQYLAALGALGQSGGLPLGAAFALQPGQQLRLPVDPQQQQQQQQGMSMDASAAGQQRSMEQAPPLGLLPLVPPHLQARPGAGEGLPPAAGPGSFMPADTMDTSQDSLKRPPAA